MQAVDTMSISRRALDLEDYLDVLRRHKGWIFGPFLVVLVLTVVGVFLWPDTYVSQAVVKVVPQQVPENLVQSTINQQMTDRINGMAQSILSRSTLTAIINSFNLYQRERSRQPIEDVIEEMRKKITISPMASMGGTGRAALPAFAIQYSYDNRMLAQKVVQDLVSKFMEANIRERNGQVTITTQFIREQWDQAKKELDDLETKVAQFRASNQGRLPDQMDQNLRQLSAMQAQIQALNGMISRVNQDKLLLESNIRIYKDQLTASSKQEAPTVEAAADRVNQRVMELDRDIQNLETQLAVLRQNYKDGHPDVQRVAGLIGLAKQKREEALKEDLTKKPAAPGVNAMQRNVAIQQARESREIENAVRRLQSQVEAKDLELQGYNQEITRINQSLKSYESRVEGIPAGEKQYLELMRDRDLARQKYLELDAKMNKTMLSQDMEQRKQGETLELLDPASLPQKPTEPNRPIVIAVGAGFGLLLGIAFAGAREMKDTSLKNLKDVRAYTQMAILGTVPLLENDFVVRRRRRLSWLGWTTACLVSAVVSSGSIVYYFVTRA